jgi:hypothetical protein
MIEAAYEPSVDIPGVQDELAVGVTANEFPPLPLYGGEIKPHVVVFDIL